MCARPDPWERWVSNHPSSPGPALRGSDAVNLLSRESPLLFSATACQHCGPYDFPLTPIGRSQYSAHRPMGRMHRCDVPVARSSTMPTTLESAVNKYLRSGNPAQRTREEYSTTLRKWECWGEGVPLDELGRREIREFLDWVNADAASRDGRNPGRTANKVRSHLRAVMGGVGTRSCQLTSQISKGQTPA